MKTLASLLVLVLAVPVFAQDTTFVESSSIKEVADVMQRFVDEKKVAGAITIVSHHGKIIHFSAVGHRDVENDLPMQQDTIVRIYSMTKPITTVAAMMLVEQGKLKLDEPIATHTPSLKDLRVFVAIDGGEVKNESAKRPPTVRDLMRHTSGFTYGFFGDSAVDKMYLQSNIIDRKSSLEDMVKKLSKMPLVNHPGTHFSYSVSTDVLGHIVEVVSGSPLDEFFADNIFQPLEMVDTGFYVPSEKLHRFSATYSPDEPTGLKTKDAPATSEFRKDPSFLSGGGGLVSTAADYLKFCQMILNEGQLNGKRLLKEETVRAMTRDQLPSEAFPIGVGSGPKREGVGFGLGFSVVVEKLDNPFNVRVGEYGWGGAASTHFWISDKDDLAVVVLTQLQPYSSQMEAALKSVIYKAIE